jgi:chromosome partitioning protein
MAGKAPGMKTVAVYSAKGGVGKSTLAVNLAWSAAALSARKTLIWDLDAQGAATFILGQGKASKVQAQKIFAKDEDPDALIRPTAYERLDLLPADASLRRLDRLFFDLGKKKRLAKLIETVGKRYDPTTLDCPPGLTDTSEQVLLAADLILAPVIPSPLSQRALDEVVAFVGRQSGKHAPIPPTYSMVDRRRALHREALDARPDWPVIPILSAIEQMATERAPVGAFAPKSPAAEAFAKLWRGVEKRIAKG